MQVCVQVCAGVSTGECMQVCVQMCAGICAGVYRCVQVCVHGEKVDACYLRGVPGRHCGALCPGPQGQLLGLGGCPVHLQWEVEVGGS